MVVGATFGSLLLLTIVEIIWFMLFTKVERYSEARERLRVPTQGDSKLRILGGELEPDFYQELLGKIEKSPVESFDLIFGPHILIEKDMYDLYIRPLENSLPTDIEWLKAHPVLQYLLDGGKKLGNMHLRTSIFDNERHFSVGNNWLRSNVCIEDPHGLGRPGGGTFTYGDWYFWRSLVNEFNSLVQSGYSEEFTLKTANQLFSRLTFEIRDPVQVNA